MRRAAVAMVAAVMATTVAATWGAPNPDKGSALAQRVQLVFDECGADRKRLSPSSRICAQRRLLDLILKSARVSTFVPALASAIHDLPGPIDANCHIYFHWIGRNFGATAKVTLGNLQRVLPATNDPSCPAGFAHGVLTSIGDRLIVAGPKRVLSACMRSHTRYEEYSCVHGLGHAYMRLFSADTKVALSWCSKIGSLAADCAQGVFHDYWFQIHGVDNTRRVRGVTPRAVCLRQNQDFVRPCWYRVFMEFPPRRPIRNPADLERLCQGLKGIQRGGCITAASAVASPDPVGQLLGCTRLNVRDQIDCVRGVNVPAVMDKPLGVQLNLAEACSQFRSQRDACFRWLGKTLNVVTNGRFVTTGCVALYPRDRRSCIAGAATMEAALETFS